MISYNFNDELSLNQTLYVQKQGAMVMDISNLVMLRASMAYALLYKFERINHEPKNYERKRFQHSSNCRKQ